MSNVDKAHVHPAARGVLEDAIAARTFPAAAVDVGSSAGSLWSDAFGTLTFDRSAAPTDVHTPFDLASLTKAIATASVAMDLVRTGALRLDERVSASFPEWRGSDRDEVTVADLLEHASGLPARLVDLPPTGRREFEHEICTIALEYAPREKSIYSDLGFILLGFLLADRGGASMASMFETLWDRLPPSQLRRHGGTGTPDTTDAGVDSVTFDLDPAARALAAPTMPMAEDLRRGRMLIGEVHDNYAAALGGVAGHAGLFGSAPAVGSFARAVLCALRGDALCPPPFTPELMRRFATRTLVPGSSRALGWDTMLPTSSCGTRMSPSAIGHVGFTGTSLWIDPDGDRYAVLLTNRVCGGGTLDQMRDVRRAFHNALD
jgi:CubicO group peptidase (beta-lactamase class C family)